MQRAALRIEQEIIDYATKHNLRTIGGYRPDISAEPRHPAVPWLRRAVEKHSGTERVVVSLQCRFPASVSRLLRFSVSLEFRGRVPETPSLIVAHNRPSGDPTPSEEDVRLTNRLTKVGEVLGVPLMDHVVIGRDAYRGLREEGMIGGWAKNRCRVATQFDVRSCTVSREVKWYEKTMG